MIEKISPQSTYLTHMSHLIGMHGDLEKELPEGVHPAFDGLQIEEA